MIGSHLNAKAAGAAMLVDVDDLSKASGVGTDDRAVDPSEFGTTFGDLIDANQQKTLPTVRRSDDPVNSPRPASPSHVDVRDKEVRSPVASVVANSTKLTTRTSQVTKSVRTVVSQDKESRIEPTSNPKLTDFTNPSKPLTRSNRTDVTPQTGAANHRANPTSSSVVASRPEKSASDTIVVSPTALRRPYKMPVVANDHHIEAHRATAEVVAGAAQPVTQPVALSISRKTAKLGAMHRKVRTTLPTHSR